MANEMTKVERRGQPSHREDLRGDLLAEAVAVVARDGHEGLSMRKLAELVGVSPGAPYHHFADRRALLIAVALEGYRAMFEKTAIPPGSGLTGEAALFHSFLGFIRFAVENPHTFTLMYESELVRPQLAPELAAAQEQGFHLLRREVAAMSSHLTERERSVRIATIWSAVFGYALQSNRAMLRAYPLEPAPDE
ncbi:MAG: TetR/AcrR family transcriptional regulator, partial [Betaproteobacteria bacterium]|nr:TetR/AcrR family transcriptional regulator [Betaproteobacteria bacterium]